MVAMIIVGLAIAWMLLSTIIIIGVAMATSQGSQREINIGYPDRIEELPPKKSVKIGRRAETATRPRPQWGEGPPGSIKPYR